MLMLFKWREKIMDNEFEGYDNPRYANPFVIMGVTVLIVVSVVSALLVACYC